MSYDRIIRDALRLARAPRRFAVGGEAEPYHPIGSAKYTENLKKFAENSHLVDKSGNPIRLYHGTSDQISYFNLHHKNRKDAGWLGEGVYLTESPMIASSYATQKRGDAGPNVMPLFARITKPYRATTEEKNRIKQIELSRGKEAAQEYSRNWTNDLKSRGNDGVIYEGPFKGMTEYVVFDPENVKSAIGNRGTFDTSTDFTDKNHGGAVGYASGGDVDQPRKLDDMGFYSSAAESARSLPQSKGTPQQMLATMKGVKPAELQWSGVQDKFADQKSVSKEDLAQHFEDNVPDIKETVLGAKIDPKILKRREEIKDMYWPEINRYRIMGDELHIDSDPDYRIRRAARDKEEEIQDKMWEHMDREAPLPKLKSTKYQEYTVGSNYGNESPSQRGYREVLLHLPGEEKFQSSHWDDKNIVAHLRMQDRGPDNDILHLEELQSDWAQKGRDEGFQDPKHWINYKSKFEELRKKAYESIYKEAIESGISEDKAEKIADKFKNIDYWDLQRSFPDEVSNLKELAEKWRDSRSKTKTAPYVTNTDHWVELGLKRALLEAARGGYNKLVWTPGEEQAKRYSLSNYVRHLEYNPNNKSLEYIRVGHSDRALSAHPEPVNPEELPQVIGKEAAERLLATSPDRYGTHRLGGIDLKFGGEGMKSFYDKILPSALRRVLKPHTDKIQPTSHVVKDNDGEDVTLPGIEITPEMRESILKKGFSYYARGGEVRQHFEDGGGAEGGSPAGDTGGSMGDTTGMDASSGPEATQDSPAFTTEAPELGIVDTAKSAIHGALGTGPGIVSAIAGTPVGALAYGMEAINNAYYDGKARADVDHGAGGPGGQESGFAPPQPPMASSSGFRLSNDDDETQAGMVKPVGFAPPPAPMMARGGVPRNSHPALSIPGVHIREEIHGRPIFLGERDG